LDLIAKSSSLTKASLRRIQAMISGLFKLARRLGHYEASNPTRDTIITPSVTTASRSGRVYNLEEVMTLLHALPDTKETPAATAVAVAAFTGIRRGELGGLDWEDVHDNVLEIRRSVWNGRLTTTKTEGSQGVVPIIPVLAKRLEAHRLRSGNPVSGPIFRTQIETRLSLDNLLTRCILPTLNKCKHCGKCEGRPHRFEEHGFERSDSVPPWRGWHAFRRGLGTNLDRLGVRAKVIAQILRHRDVAVTFAHYIKPDTSDATAAMEKFAAGLDAETGTSSFGTHEKETKRVN
jgi:integrase